MKIKGIKYINVSKKSGGQKPKFGSQVIQTYEK